MIIPKKNRLAILSALFRDGVMVAVKNWRGIDHFELEGIPNLQVIKLMTSLKSRGYVNEQFAWRHYYWFLTDDGIEYLREYLHLPAEIVPATLHKPLPNEAMEAGGYGRDGGRDGGRGFGRGAY
eukprot:CAMPEP_0181297704 /NCGR_PEP_ID=MMETSP1101-20121128/5387_1 /TAXON_ID=46948 /ORGANISM="Rhodomonas abbreviata, Strain Caron Lab Isolate" /LENGTH=123 /DNA_ID=CAMNT_0023402669 /DNA_START=34 /DNA_END=405 /DNA_ORIENTATION=-